MGRLAAAVLASALLAAVPASAEARSCKPKKEERGCVVRSAEWTKLGGFGQRSASVSVSGNQLEHSIAMIPGSPSGDYPSAPRRCGVIMSTQSAQLFSGAPRIKGPIKIGGTYSKRSTWRSVRNQPGFRDPGGAFGGDAFVQSLEATYRLTVKIVSAKRARISASGTTTAKVMRRDPASPDSDPKYIPGTFTCTATYNGTVSRGRY